MATDSHKAAGNIDFRALFVAFKSIMLCLDVGSIGRDLIAMAERSYTDFLERFHLLAADLEHLVEILLLALLIFLILCHKSEFSYLFPAILSL